MSTLLCTASMTFVGLGVYTLGFVMGMSQARSEHGKPTT